MFQTNRQLRARVRELETENEQLKGLLNPTPEMVAEARRMAEKHARERGFDQGGIGVGVMVTQDGLKLDQV